jgi:hypothetical protein
VLEELVMADGAKLSSGRYLLLGEGDGHVWLLPCNDMSAAVYTSADTIALRIVLPFDTVSGTLSIAEVLRDPPGFVPACQ